MSSVQLTKAEARKIILHAAALHKTSPFGKGKDAVRKVIDHLGFVQVDTNYVVERAHHHTLAARIPGYQKAWLDELQAEGLIYEFWTRDSGYMPMSEFRFSLPITAAFSNKWKEISPAERNLMNKILDRISREGPRKAKDFENDRVKKSTGWWDWRPSKIALEQLHLSGKLLATRTKEFHKRYDLVDNIVPAEIDRTPPSPEEYTQHLIFRSLRSLGIAYAKEIAWNGRFVKPPVKQELQKLADAGEVMEVTVEGVKGPLYMLPEYKKKKITLSNHAFILSPFDPLNVFRHRLKDFFSFDYQVECFVPEKKRKYGYFSLPILVGDTFVARMDSKADRKAKTLIIHNLHAESGRINNVVAVKVRDAIHQFATFNECSEITIRKSNDKAITKMI